MFKKMLPWLIMILVAITLIVLATFVLYNYFVDKGTPTNPNEAAVNSVQGIKGKQLSAEQIKNNTFEINDITTNLSVPDYYLRASFTFELDSKKAKEELELLDFKVKSIIYQTLVDVLPQQIENSNGRDELLAVITNKINQSILTKGKLKQIYITNFVMNH